MSGPTVRISSGSRRVLRSLAKRTGKSMQSVLDEAVEDFRRKMFLGAVNAGYAALRADAKAWVEELAERRAWEATLQDGLAEQGACTNGRRPSGRKRSTKR